MSAVVFNEAKNPRLQEFSSGSIPRWERGYFFSSSSAILKQRRTATSDACSDAKTSFFGRGFQHIDASPMASQTAM